MFYYSSIMNIFSNRRVWMVWNRLSLKRGFGGCGHRLDGCDGLGGLGGFGGFDGFSG